MVSNKSIKSYARLWGEFQEFKFNYKQARRVITKSMNTVLSELAEEGWLIKHNSVVGEEYSLIAPEVIIHE